MQKEAKLNREGNKEVIYKESGKLMTITSSKM
jgi:hypothetical protein